MSQPLYTFTADALSDPVEVVRFEGVEEISRLFRFEITIATSNPSLSFDDLVGTPGQLTLQIGKEPRHVHGIILALAQHQVGKKLNYYQITLVPELWKAHKKQKRPASSISLDRKSQAESLYWTQYSRGL